MLYILSDGTIRLTRGDTARLTVQIQNDLGDVPYVIADDDTLEFSIKKNVRDETALVHKTIVGSNMFTIEPTDTKQLSFGKYVYDVQLTNADGDVYTVIVPTTFEVMKEVT